MLDATEPRGEHRRLPQLGPGGIMRNDVLLRSLVLGLAVFAGALGCSQEADQAPTPGFPAQTGQLPRGANQAAYPEGPYGIAVNSIIANYQFAGYAAPDLSKNGMQLIQMSDFYNPTGTDVYPEGSPYGAGKAKPKALLVVLSAVWCGPCNQEADVVLPPLHAKYRPQGGEFVLALADGPSQGVPAEPKHLTSWATKYDLDYPCFLDTSGIVPAITSQDAYPANVIVRTKDMKIVRSITGSPEAADWKIYEKVIADTLP